MTAGPGSGAPLDLAFLIRSLGSGGAERQLVALAKGLHLRGHRVRVFTYYGGGLFEGDLKAAGVPVVSLQKGGRWDLVAFSLRLLRLLRRDPPQVVHAYLGTSNILVALLKPFLRRTRVVWGVRAAQKDMSQYDPSTRVAYWVECRLSRWADLIIANSQAGRRHAALHGFPAKRMTVIPNGIDTARFRPEPELRKAIRAAWGVAEDEPLVGLVGRMDPVKDHQGFLRAAATVAKVHPKARFICIGGGPADIATRLAAEADRLGLGQRLRWEAPRADMPGVYSALDLLVSSSRGEGFSNVIAEAMACGVAAVVTDVGDSAWIVEGSGLVVPPGNPDALAGAVLAQLGKAGGPGVPAPRDRITEQFAVVTMVERTEAALAEVIGGRP